MMAEGTTSNESIYMRLGELSGKLDTVLQQTANAQTEAAVGRALALSIETRLKENQTVEKANAAASQMDNVKFFQRRLVAPASFIGLIISALLASHYIWHWP